MNQKPKSKIFYTSDLHLGHANVIKYDGRPFESVDEMDEALIDNWNSVVGRCDTVYVLGDLVWGSTDRWREYIPKLNGYKYLIKGNHDLKEFPTDVRRMFYGIYDYKEITDEGRRVIMSHYCMPFYRADYNPNIYHLYGHMHNTDEEAMLLEIKKWIQNNDPRDDVKSKCQFYNAWCGYYDYRPVTLDQILDKWKDEE